jgi:hypothetical protein
MTKDSIVEEVRSARQKIFDACNEDLDTLMDRFQEQEQLDRERLVSDLSSQPQQDAKKFNRVRPE